LVLEKFRNRLFMFHFQRQADASLTLCLTYMAFIFAALWVFAAVTGRWAAQGFRKPAVIVISTMMALCGVIAWVAVDQGAELVRVGETAPELESGLSAIDRDFRERSQQTGAPNVTVVTFGDSTQLTLTREFKDALAIALDRDQPGTFQTVGLAHPGMTAREYYLLVNMIAKYRPAIVVLPIDIVTFEESWFDTKFLRFHGLERFLRIDELPQAAALSTNRQQFSWKRVLLRKVDAAVFRRTASRFIAGLQLSTRHTFQRWSLILHGAGHTIPTAADPMNDWNRSPRTVTVSSDNDMIRMFEAINVLTARHDIRVLYYTTPINDEAQMSKGIYFQPDKNFGTIERALSGSPHVTFLQLHDSLPKSLFRDDLVHLNVGGIHHLADRVAQAVEEVAATTPAEP
jgi:hypothetical protein